MVCTTVFILQPHCGMYWITHLAANTIRSLLGSIANSSIEREREGEGERRKGGRGYVT